MLSRLLTLLPLARRQGDAFLRLPWGGWLGWSRCLPPSAETVDKLETQRDDAERRARRRAKAQPRGTMTAEQHAAAWQAMEQLRDQQDAERAAALAELTRMEGPEMMPWTPEAEP